MKVRKHWLEAYWSPIVVLPAWGIATFALPGFLADRYFEITGLSMLKLELVLAIFSYFAVLYFYPAHSRLCAFMFACVAALVIANWNTEPDGNRYQHWGQMVVVYTALLYIVTGGALFLVRLRTRRPLKL